jgi:hypothetical protein
VSKAATTVTNIGEEHLVLVNDQKWTMVTHVPSKNTDASIGEMNALGKTQH